MHPIPGYELGWHKFRHQSCRTGQNFFHFRQSSLSWFLALWLSDPLKMLARTRCRISGSQTKLANLRSSWSIRVFYGQTAEFQRPYWLRSHKNKPVGFSEEIRCYISTFLDAGAWHNLQLHSLKHRDAQMHPRTSRILGVDWTFRWWSHRSRYKKIQG